MVAISLFAILFTDKIGNTYFLNTSAQKNVRMHAPKRIRVIYKNIYMYL